MLSALESLGVHHIRDGFYPWTSNSQIVQNHKALASAGIRTDYVVPYSLTTTPTAVATLAGETGDLESVEAPNECDVNSGCGGTGLLALANLVSFLPVVNGAAGKLGVPAIGPSFVLQGTYPLVGNLDGDMSVNNLHIYFGGRNPGSTGWGAADAQGHAYGSFDWWLDQAAIDGPGKPVEITETGYIATPTTSTPYTLPESVEASYIPRTLLLAYRHGFKRTLLYELLDEKSSPGYGLLHSDFSPKPAFTAVRNLLATLDDDGTGAFTAGSLPYVISGGGTTLNHLLLEKRDGSYWLVLWLEESSWNPAHVASIAVTPQNISLQLGSAFKTTKDFQFDANGEVTPFNQPMSGDTAGLTVTDRVSIVEIVPR